MNKKFDNVFLGLGSGILLPLLSVMIIYLYRFDNYSVNEFFDFMKTMKVFSKLISLCVIPNLLIFFIFIWTHKDHSARGVLGATILWAFVIAIIKFTI